jgi:hypothetical protein
MKNSCVRMLCMIVLASSAAFLTGCETVPKVPTVPGDTKTVEFDRALLKDCPDLPKAKSGADTDLKDWAASVTGLYVECATNKKKENREVKKAFNLKD